MAGCTETSANVQTPATSMAKHSASSHSSGTEGKTGLQEEKNCEGGNRSC